MLHDDERIATHELPWHSVSADEVLSALGTRDRGLSTEEASRRLETFGPNQIPPRRRAGRLALLARQVHNALVWVLLGAAAVALSIGKATDAAVVLAVVVLNTVIGFIQEARAGDAIEALSKMVPERAVVLRGGHKTTLAAAALVPGDIVTLAAGDRVPADVRLRTLHNLQIDEAALTGESAPVEKTSAAVTESAELGDRVCLAFGGTVVTRGTAQGIVVATGERTELGRISGMLAETVELQTPLTEQLQRLGRSIGFGVAGVAACVLPLSLWRGYGWAEAMLVSVTLAVAAIPEGLPAVVTIGLAIGVQRMAARNAIVRRLPAVETLGSTSVICTDKTGTLTKNEMTVQALWTPRGEHRLTDLERASSGVVSRDEPSSSVTCDVRELLMAGALCNDAFVTAVKNGGVRVTGEPTEAALLTAAERLGLGIDRLHTEHPRLASVPFESEHRFMATVHGGFEDGARVLVKGAPEVVLALCGSSTPNELAAAHREVERLAAGGMRVLAFASKRNEGTLAPGAVSAGGFHLLGLQGMIDPPRQESVDAVARCHDAGIVVKMITGDHKLTARAIAREIGLGDAEPITGAEISTMDEAALQRAATSTNVFARVAPEHKLRLVRALQAERQVIAMTGDGVNDAPALRQANIGIAMGITGTSVAKEASDIVLADDNFASIAAAVEEGRRVYDNLIKSMAFILPTNLGLALILVAAVMFFPMALTEHGSLPLLPLTPRQLLWLNLVTSVALSFPLILEVTEREVMSKPPRRPDAPLLGGFMITRTVLVALVLAASSIGVFFWEYGSVSARVGHPLALAEARTAAVTTVASFQIFYMLNCRSLHHSVWRIGFFSNPWIFVGIALLTGLQLGFVYAPWMQRIFETAPLAPASFFVSMLAGASILPCIALEKQWRSRRLRKARRALSDGSARWREKHA